MMQGGVVVQGQSMPVKRVLIAHQSTIPHYRVPFYQAVERLRPRWWEFSVIYDAAETRRTFFIETDVQQFVFKIEQTHTIPLGLGSRRLCLQTFPFRAWPYDLIVVGSALNNVAYPLSSLWRLGGKAIAYWGHGRDSSIEHPAGLKGLAERTKIWLTSRADGFFAYTKGVRDFLVRHGIAADKIFTLYNTIDIEAQRHRFNSVLGQREKLRHTFHVHDKKTLLFVGRLNKRKNLDFLTETLAHLRQKNPAYHLLLIGGGDASLVSYIQERCGKDAVSYHGVVSEHDIGRFYIISDLYIFPGAVGLGPLQALCFDVTPTVIDAPIHNPEYEYLNETNAVILPRYTSPQEYALAIDQHLEDREKWQLLRSQAWPSIKHLTIDNMAKNFIHGINTILRRDHPQSRLS
jgi:glycosyltransferase involved in cell wall biosynthesis